MNVSACSGRGRIGDAVLELLGVAAEPVDLGDEGGEAIGLVAAQVRDTGEPGRSFGQRGHRRDDGGQLADVVQVELDAVERRRRR